MRNLILAAAAGLLATQSAAQTPPAPKLLVVISVDQLSEDLFDQYRPQFTGGFARLASGTVFRNAAGPPATQTLGQLVKSRWPASRDVIVSGSQAVTTVQGPDQRWTWTGKKFEADRASAPLPRVVPKVNAAIAAALARPRPPLQPTPFCESKALPGEVGGQLGRGAGDAAALEASPELDGDTLALAAGLVDELQLGRRAAPDLLTINLAATGNVARTHGVVGEGMCLQLIELDRELGDFLSLLESRRIDYAISLTGTGSQRVPLLFWRTGMAATTVERAVDRADVSPTLASMVGVPLQPGLTGHCLAEVPGARC
ncbi:MAG: hypothetical protein ACJ8FT_09145 [Sphingomonas sp.]